ncbi:hypothetical protein H105_01886 [Trichophyton soudanense CBS 452.61]|uniref:Uncharacterized protein n=1 Tax=Trichophyton soudanense CBS 452.61 TaxID=1215331 RepID=A0A022Y145_TRISD|nr:hypothetical protein H105_01886 [Trichophyton soudanense CBS 452.61]EZG09195.1 hypothetical protein H106_01732 [Trichophyton rubrum CBS 735.88]
MLAKNRTQVLLLISKSLSWGLSPVFKSKIPSSKLYDLLRRDSCFFFFFFFILFVWDTVRGIQGGYDTSNVSQDFQISRARGRTDTIIFVSLTSNRRWIRVQSRLPVDRSSCCQYHQGKSGNSVVHMKDCAV